MNLKLSLLLPLAAMLLFSCETETPEIPDENTPFLGTWINPVYTDSTRTYSRAEGLMDNEYGLSILENHSVLERKNSGWCGTPPISYADFQGNWLFEDDTLRLNVDFWGGTSELTWIIRSVDENEMVILPIRENYPLPR